MTKEELLKAIADLEVSMNRVLLEIGQEYSIAYLENDQKKINAVNQNVQLYNQMLIRKNSLREELLKDV